MADLGNILLFFLFPVSVFTALTALAAGITKRRGLLEAARRGAYAAFAVTTLAVLALEYLLVTSDFSIEYVASNTNFALPLFYKIVALWAGHNGSLLLWTWIVTIFIAIVAYQHRHKNNDLMPYVLFVMGSTMVFFSILSVFISNPFQTLYQEVGNTLQEFTARDGHGLNPLLQHPAMVIHPPVLFIGYVGSVVPFAFAIAALITGKLGTEWIHTTRRWALTTWGFLAVGIILGGKWAYVELGWGGYWAWDPVENASLLPWLTSTAYLHSVMIQERKGMLKIWNMALVIATYLLAIFGTFLTRSGIVSSVHAFANSGLGPAFAIFLSMGIIFSVTLLLYRRKDLKPDEEMESLVSRESGFLFNNLLFLLATIAVLWGTMFPVISELFTGDQITVGPPWFNNIMIPIGLALLLLTGAGPLLAWRHTSVETLKRSFGWPILGSIIFIMALYAFGIHDGWALGSFAISFFVMWTILVEFVKGANIRRKNSGENFLLAMYMLSRKNTRRYGGYLIHAAMVVMFVGFTGNAFNSETRAEVGEGDSFNLGPYTFNAIQITEAQTENYSSQTLELEMFRNDRLISTISPEKRYYFASEQPSTEVDIYSTLREDIYAVLSGMSNDGTKVIVQVYRNPLVNMVWIGAFIMGIGTLFAMLPNLRENKAGDK
ncbi:MAG: heme lyase CcmF/NrfE family subunit [Candidatus Marinimicrobia bacterium]|jgi:cytochrome c-type biogenesis protein CcmF|nr:heme lyase CcmF/NrfE family subunit [Candidatus Neomarinimicrobiota bacterium]MBT3630366.1 heme lyase CcmF/NrfE family subunit [Candidatus Neomarinimicrobiota bacterium]MBT3823686.1 heme lyase CcmF/NrfE family subunit [Candidatus Neomarinimicrobiota bacterium]MBT4131966.1 heme lyase CcmF/NrfE family subunit [Candidatus Neomarinimicrobiota bacterium]MBT4294691.1 heme lyase CcmF/NrfE family subunit [Candidatus Neomarinimicrobiota bacterium]